MLNSHYHNIIVGKNYISLIVAIVKARTSSVLLIDEPRVILGRGWYQNVGATEKHLLELIGKKHEIESLSYLDSYLTPINTIIYLNDKIIELGSSPYDNIRELMRKVPDLFNTNLITDFLKLNHQEFDRECFELFRRLAEKVYLEGNTIQNCVDAIKSEAYLKNIYSSVQEHFVKGKHNPMGKQLQFVLQVLFQTFFSNSGGGAEAIYLFTSVLSPRFQIDEKKLSDDLIFHLRSLGGDTKATNIQNWETHHKELKYILLSSYEGLIGLDNLYFFGSLPPSVPFENSMQNTIFNSIEIRAKVDHPFLKHYTNKRILFSRLDHLGSDSPHWEVLIDHQGAILGTYSYAVYPGSKPSFYYQEVTRDFYSSLVKLLPGLSFEHFSDQIELNSGKDLWLESRGGQSGTFYANRDRDLTLFHKENGETIKHLEYWGPLKAKSLGLYSYLLDLQSRGMA